MGQWGNGNTISKLVTLQKHAIRIINNKGYKNNTDPLLKSQNILKIVDVYKLHVSLFVYNFHHNLLPKSFIQITISKRIWTKVAESQDNTTFLRKRDLETHLSSKLPKRNFTKMWNTIEMKNIKQR